MITITLTSNLTALFIILAIASLVAYIVKRSTND